MTHQTKTLQLGEPARLQVHALQEVHSHGFGRLTDLPLTGSSGWVVRITGPDGVSIDVTLNAGVDDEATGLFGADATAGEVNLSGTWRLQGRFTKSGIERKTLIGTFEVESNLPDPP